MNSDSSDSEARVREAVSRGHAPALGDVRAVLALLDQTRVESEQRWQAIGSLAPAAKHHRARAQGQERLLAALDQHLRGLADMLASTDCGEAAGALRAWLDEARRIVSGNRSL